MSSFLMPPSSAPWPISRVVAGSLLAALAGWGIGWGWEAAGGRTVAKSNGQVVTEGASHDPVGLEADAGGKGRIADAALPGLVQKVLASRQRDRRMHDLYEVAEKLSAAQFPVLISLLQKQKDGELDGELLAYWLEADFANARAYIGRTPVKELNDGLVWRAAETWARINAKDLEAWYYSLPAKDKAALEPDGISTLASSMAPFDPERAVRLLTKSSGTATPEGLDQVLAEWAERNPAAAAARSLALPASRIRDQALKRVIGQWVTKDPAGARGFVEGIQDAQLRGEALLSLCEALKDTDPKSAADTLAQFNVSARPARRAVSSVLTAWAEKDLQAALDWASDLPDSPVQRFALGRIIDQAATTDPDLAVKLYRDAQAAGMSPDANITVTGIARSLAEKEGIVAASAFLENLPAEEQKSAFKQACWPILNQLGAPAAAEQALQIPNEMMRDELLCTAAIYIGRSGDWKSATQAVQRVPAGAERDAVTLRVAADALLFEPETGMELFEVTPGGHQRMIEEAGKWITSTNRVSAEKWIRSSAVLSDEERSALLEKLPSGRSGTAAGQAPP